MRRAEKKTYKKLGVDDTEASLMLPTVKFVLGWLQWKALLCSAASAWTDYAVSLGASPPGQAGLLHAGSTGARIVSGTFHALANFSMPVALGGLVTEAAVEVMEAAVNRKAEFRKATILEGANRITFGVPSFLLSIKPLVHHGIGPLGLVGACALPAFFTVIIGGMLLKQNAILQDIDQKLKNKTQDKEEIQKELDRLKAEAGEAKLEGQSQASSPVSDDSTLSPSSTSSSTGALSPISSKGSRSLSDIEKNIEDKNNELNACKKEIAILQEQRKAVVDSSRVLMVGGAIVLGLLFTAATMNPMSGSVLLLSAIAITVFWGINTYMKVRQAQAKKAIEEIKKETKNVDEESKPPRTSSKVNFWTRLCSNIGAAPTKTIDNPAIPAL